jgi:uncharacterized peroxidase-related enzyme
MSSRVPTPASIDAAPAASKPLLEAVKQALGVVPNMFRIISQSPAALEGFLALRGALAKGALDPNIQARIGITVAETNGSTYCLSAFTYLAANVAKLPAPELKANRDGTSSDPKAQAALQFAHKLVAEHGKVPAGEVDALKAAGFSPGEIVELILHTAMHTFTNYLNSAVATEVDFPVIAAKA